FLYFVDDIVGRHAIEHFLKRFITSVRSIHVECARVLEMNSSQLKRLTTDGFNLHLNVRRTLVCRVLDQKSSVEQCAETLTDDKLKFVGHSSTTARPISDRPSPVSGSRGNQN